MSKANFENSVYYTVLEFSNEFLNRTDEIIILVILINYFKSHVLYTINYALVHSQPIG